MTSIIHPLLFARVNAVEARDAMRQASSTLLAVRPPSAQPAPVPSELADTALHKLTQALEVSGLSTDVRTALTRAHEQALAGARLLTAPAATVRVDRTKLALSFDGAAMWADLAANLIDLDLKGRPSAPVDVEPPVTILPVEPITIQLPPSDSEIQ
jgi:hypothetical protein